MIDLDALLALILQTLRENGEEHRNALKQAGAMEHFRSGMEFERRQHDKVRRAGLIGAVAGMVGFGLMIAIAVGAVIYFGMPHRGGVAGSLAGSVAGSLAGPDRIGSRSAPG